MKLLIFPLMYDFFFENKTLQGRRTGYGWCGFHRTDFFSKKKFFLKVFLDFKNNAYKYAIQSSQILKTGLKNKTLCSDE